MVGATSVAPCRGRTGWVDDLDEGERRVLDAGASKAERQPGVRFRVYLDPLGQPFCLVLCHGVPTPG